MNTTVSVTRYNVFTRTATDEQDERDVVRFFEKRKLVGELDLDKIAREEWEAGLDEMIANGQSSDGRNHLPTLDEVIEFLTSEDEGDEGDEEPEEGDEEPEEGDEEPEEGDEEEERDSSSVVPAKYRIIYGAPQNCGDEIALALTEFVTEPRKTKKHPDGGLDRAKLRAVCETNGLGDKLANWEDRGLNGGLLRMNTSNVLRGMNRRGERVQIGGMLWEACEVEKKSRRRAPKKGASAKKAN